MLFKAERRCMLPWKIRQNTTQELLTVSSCPGWPFLFLLFITWNLSEMQVKKWTSLRWGTEAWQTLAKAKVRRRNCPCNIKSPDRHQGVLATPPVLQGAAGSICQLENNLIWAAGLSTLACRIFSCQQQELYSLNHMLEAVIQVQCMGKNRCYCCWSEQWGMDSQVSAEVLKAP